MDEELTEKLLNPIEQEVKKFNKKAAGAGWNMLVRVLSTVTEPFFRKDMGERYYTDETHGIALMFWLTTTVFCYYTLHHTSIVWDWLQFLKETQHIDTSAYQKLLHRRIGVVILGATMFLLQLRWGSKSLLLMKQYRNEAKTYHTRSRGVPRWGKNNIFVGILIVVLLFIFNIPAAIMFIAGVAVNFKQKHDQDAAIMSRYYDALDEAVEKEHLRDAALSKCPTELTYLNRPIDPSYNPKVKEGIADALVGQPVQIFGDESEPGSPAPKSTPPPNSPKPKEQPQPRPAQSLTQSFAKPAEPVRATEPPPATQTSAKAKSNPSPIFQPAAAAKVMKENDPEQYVSLWRISRLVRMGFRFLLIVTLAVLLGVVLRPFVQAHFFKPAASVAQADPQPLTPPRNANPPPPQAPPVIPKAVVPESVAPAAVQPAKALPPPVTPAPAQAVSVARNDSPQPQTHQVIPKPSIPESPSPPAVQLAKTPTPLATPTPEHAGGVAAELDAYKKFEAYCTATFKVEEERVQQLPDNSNTDALQKETHSLKRSLQQILHTQYANMRDLRSGVPEDEAAVRALPPMFASRQSASNSLLRLHNQIDKAMIK